MKQSASLDATEKRVREPYSEPLLIKHEPLRNVTGTKYGEKYLAEKESAES